MFPGALCASGRPERSFQLNTRIRGAGLMRTRNNGQAAVSGRRGNRRRSSRLPWAAYPGPWENILRTVSQNLWSAIQTHLPAEAASGCPVRSLRTGHFCFPQPVSVCRSGGPAAEHRRRNSMEKKDSAAAHAGGGAGAGGFVRGAGFCGKRRAGRTGFAHGGMRGMRRLGRLHGMPGQGRGMRGVRREKHLRGLRRLRQDRGTAKPVLQYGMVPAAAAHCHHAGAHHKRRCILHCL